MNKIRFAAALIAGTTLLWACGNNKEKSGDNLATGETTITDSASTTPATTGATGGTLDTMDQNFAMTAASSDMLEIQAANMAMQKASSDRVKSYATMMIKDHGQTSTELKSIVAGKNVTLPTDMMPMHKSMLDNLQSKTGKEFDQAYAQLNVTSHQEAVNLFQRASTSARDAAIKNFATKHLPHLQMHLDSAQAINKGKM